MTAWVKAVDSVSFTGATRVRHSAWSASRAAARRPSGGDPASDPYTGGTTFFDGEDVFTKKGAELKALRRNMQIVFQNPYSSLDPRMPVGWRNHRRGFADSWHRDQGPHAEIVTQMLAKVGLNPFLPCPPVSARILRRPPPANRHRTRPGAEPEVGDLRRAGAALDVSIQSQVLNLLNLLPMNSASPTCSSHTILRVVEHISDRIGVMYLGKIVELTEHAELYRNPLHPYTQRCCPQSPCQIPGSTASASY